MSRRPVVLVRPNPPDEDLTEICRAAGAELAGTRVKRITLALGDGLAQVRRISTLPPVSQARLRAIIGGEPARFVRVAQEPLTLDAGWLPTGKPPLALVVAAPTLKLEAAVEGFRLAGVRVERIVVEGYESANVDLLPANERRRRLRREWKLAGWLGFSAALLWLGLAARWTASLRIEERELRSRLAEIEPASGAVAEARHQVDQTAITIRALDSIGGRRGRMVIGLADAASGLPDQAFLTALSADRDSIRLAGLAVSPARLVERLGKRPSLERPRLLPPVSGRAVVGVPGMAPFEIVAGRGRLP